MTFQSLQVLDYETLKEILIGFTESPTGSETVRKLSPFFNQAEPIREELRVTGECIRLDEGLTGRFQELANFSPLFEKLSLEGLILEPREILQIIGLALCAKWTKRSLAGLGAESPAIAALGREIPALADLLCSIEGKITPAGEVEDSASAQLKRLRNEIDTLRNRLFQALGKILQRHSLSQAIQDDVITIRNERFVIPIRVDNRKELSGVVHGTSSSGATVFLEPLETLELNNQLVRLKEKVEEEIRNILRAFTQKVREHLGELQSAVRILGYLDFSFAKARFAKSFKCVIPKINEGGILSIENGRHPILERSLSSDREVVPISIGLNPSAKILVISGPNTGGKTVALKTAGLLTLMALSGIPVPATFANVPVVEQVFTDIGDRQSIAENLSTFSSHLVNIREILETVSVPALVLLDELGTGTDPSEGSALGVAIVEHLRQKGAMAIVTTHHNGLKMYAATTPGVANASVEFDEASLRPTFRLIQGVSGNSSGIEIAKKLGLDETILAHARQLVSTEEKQVAQFSQRLSKQIDQNSTLRLQLESELKSLEVQKKSLQEKLSRLEAQKQKELELARQNAFARFEHESRKLLGGIRDKYLSVRVRKEIEKKAAKLREGANQELSLLMEENRCDSATTIKGIESRAPILVGSKVRVKRFGQEGTVIASHGDSQWEVVVGNLKCLVGGDELETIGKQAAVNERLQAATSCVMVQLNSPELQSNEIDLIGCTVDEAICRVDKFLDSAFLASISPVRLIHGTGMGVLRKALSEWLSHQPYVEKFQTAEASQGGNGVTIVSLKAE